MAETEVVRDRVEAQAPTVPDDRLARLLPGPLRQGDGLPFL
jgi:hypothetical protein